MKHFIQLSVIAAFSLLVSCSTGTSSSDGNTASGSAGTNNNAAKGLTVSKDDVLKEIATAENSLYNVDKFTFDPVKANAVVSSYEKFANTYPDDPKTPDYLFKSGEIFRSLKKYQKAIDTYESIYKNHSSYEKAPHSLFLMGFSYENDVKNNDKAKECYTEFLGKYPKHDLAKDVKFSLENLGKSPEDIIKEFEKRNK